MTALLRSIGLMVLLVAVPASFSLAQLLEDCEFDAKQAEKFRMFDHEFRQALSERDLGKLALLVNYPLRVNDQRGSLYIKDAHSLNGHFLQIFTPQLRELIADKRKSSVSCMTAGIMYSNGLIWVEDEGHGYLIRTINLPPPSNGKRFRIGKSGAACSTDLHRVAVDTGRDGVPRLRLWEKPHSLTSKPDQVARAGTFKIQGTGGCAHGQWTFRESEKKIVISELGCYADSNEPPPDAKGQLSISSNEKDQEWWWCF